MEKNLLLLILVSTLIKSDTEFIFSYKLRTENSYITNQSIYISKAMVLTNLPKKRICTINAKYDGKSPIKSFLQKNSATLFKCFQKKGVLINSHQQSTLHNLNSQITIKSKPIRFTVKFNNGFGIISAFIKQ